MSSAAQFDEPSESYLPTGTEGGTALKQLAAERLAAHRSRRAVVEGREAQARREQAIAQAAIRLQAQCDAARSEVHPDASRVREKVAARYEQILSYRESLAAEAQRVMNQAQAEAQVAAVSAKAVVEAQRKLLNEMEQWSQPQPQATGNKVDLFGEMPLLEVVEQRAAQPVQRAKMSVREEAAEIWSAPPPARLQVRLLEEIERASAAAAFYAPVKKVQIASEEMAELDEEIEFRRAPEFHDLVMETMPIQANIIEFPRQLVASRKARPRLAEGPLRDEGTAAPQLRIFEVEAEQISLAPEVAVADEAPEWQGLLLGAGTSSRVAGSMSPQLEAQLQMDIQFYAATLPKRLFSAMVDVLCLGAGVAGFAAVALKIAGPGLRGEPLPLLGAAVAGTVVVFAVLYQMLFFTLNEATPGMRAARIAFCTFQEKSPTRKAMRRRLFSTALAACPLGLGLVWTALDSDRLGWHDRMSRMYPRSY
ncbi:MAG TPA: RDD family protein [Acidobacteriaceae bacterium]